LIRSPVDFLVLKITFKNISQSYHKEKPQIIIAGGLQAISKKPGIDFQYKRIYR
jgi:hypothetical protein